MSAGQPVVRLAHAGSREAVIQLPETLRPAVGSVAQAELFGKPGLRVPATLRQLSDTADARTRTFEARYVLQGTLGRRWARPSRSASRTTHARRRKPACRCRSARCWTEAKAGVWVVAGDLAKVGWRPVTVEHVDDDSARVSGALKQGDRVVALGAQLLHDGDAVRVAAQAATLASEGARP